MIILISIVIIVVVVVVVKIVIVILFQLRAPAADGGRAFGRDARGGGGAALSGELSVLSLLCVLALLLLLQYYYSLIDITRGTTCLALRLWCVFFGPVRLPAAPPAQPYSVLVRVLSPKRGG